MYYTKSLTVVRVFSLGAINGLIVGLALEKARQTYWNYQMTRSARAYAETDIFADFIETGWEPLVPLVCIAVFPVVASLIYCYFLNRARLLLVVWFGLGIVALSLGYFMSTSNPDIFSLLSLLGLVVVGYLVHRLWKGHPDSLSLLWAINGISAVIVVAVGVQLVGLFFYWPELRRPLVWLICLASVVAVNAVFGAIVQFVITRLNGRRVKEVGAQ